MIHHKGTKVYVFGVLDNYTQSEVAKEGDFEIFRIHFKLTVS